MRRSLSSDKSPYETSSKASKQHRYKNKREFVSQLVKQWHQKYDVFKKDKHFCFNAFVRQYSKGMKIKIKFDNSISSLLLQLSKQVDYLQFNGQKQNKLKTFLQIINQILKENNFISERQYQKFNSQFLSIHLQDSLHLLQQHLKREGQNKKIQNKMLPQQKQAVTKMWDNFMGIPFENFWKFILKEKISDQKIFLIFQSYEEFFDQEASRELKKQVVTHLKEIIDSKKQEKLFQEPKTCSKFCEQIFNSTAEEISVYFHKQRWQKCQEQYNILTSYLLKICQNKRIRFQPYGSFQSKFYIAKYSDIDIGLYYNESSSKDRQKVCNILTNICDAINADKDHIPLCKFAKTFKEDQIKVPFVKVYYSKDECQNRDIAPTIDIIINNYEGIQNSKLMGQYAENQFILKFCNLVKYWAVHQNLINLQRKMEGLSSYGILLMCLYYLMVTKQIPYLKIINQKYEIGIDEFNIKLNFLNNFIGFLKFYACQYFDRETESLKIGQFHSQKRIACLLEHNQGKKVYDDNFIINMYDFIDGSNPGRMKNSLYDKFQQIFNEAITFLQEIPLQFINNVYGQNKDKNQNKLNIPKKANRFN